MAGNKLEPTQVFTCLKSGCDKLQLNSPTEIYTHLEQAHQVKDRKGKREILVHMNTGEGHLYSYEWTIGGVKINESRFNPKRSR